MEKLCETCRFYINSYAIDPTSPYLRAAQWCPLPWWDQHYQETGECQARVELREEAGIDYAVDEDRMGS